MPLHPTGRYPLATIAYYGPTNAVATKLVASVLRKPTHEPAAMRTWFSSADVRNDRVVADELMDWLTQHRVAETVTTGRIIGCPHQEGIDYPLGRTCPQCPFWANIDRFTHEPIVVPAPTMTPSEVIAVLSETLSEPSIEALVSADAHHEALVAPLLAALDRGIADPTGASEWDANLFAHALYLFAKWREPRAYGHVCRWLSLPDERPFDIAGDVVTQDGGRILAAVCDGDLAPIKALILNREADEYGRSAGAIALSLLAAWGEVPRRTVIDLMAWLMREGLEREHVHIWESLASAALDIEADELVPDIRQAYANDFINPQYMSLADVEEALAHSPGVKLAETRESWPPIDDVAEATAWWACYAKVKTKVGRNDPCPCGSGRKYKKCCGR